MAAWGLVGVDATLGWLNIATQTCRNLGASVPVSREGQQCHSVTLHLLQVPQHFCILLFSSSLLGGGRDTSFFSYLRTPGQMEKLLPLKLFVTKPYLKILSKPNGKRQFKGKNCSWPSSAPDSPKSPAATFCLELNPCWGGRTGYLLPHEHRIQERKQRNSPNFLTLSNVHQAQCLLFNPRQAVEPAMPRCACWLLYGGWAS